MARILTVYGGAVYFSKNIPALIVQSDNDVVNIRLRYADNCFFESGYMTTSTSGLLYFNISDIIHQFLSTHVGAAADITIGVTDRLNAVWTELKISVMFCSSFMGESQTEFTVKHFLTEKNYKMTSMDVADTLYVYDPGIVVATRRIVREVVFVGPDGMTQRVSYNNGAVGVGLSHVETDFRKIEDDARSKTSVPAEYEACEFILQVGERRFSWYVNRSAIISAVVVHKNSFNLNEYEFLFGEWTCKVASTSDTAHVNGKNVSNNRKTEQEYTILSEPVDVDYAVMLAMVSAGSADIAFYDCDRSFSVSGIITEAEMEIAPNSDDMKQLKLKFVPSDRSRMAGDSWERTFSRFSAEFNDIFS